jgi:hypothetical protein
MPKSSLPIELEYNVYPAFRRDPFSIIDHRASARVETVPHTPHVGYYIDLHSTQLIPCAANSDWPILAY